MNDQAAVRAAFCFFHDDGFMNDDSAASDLLNGLDGHGFDVHVSGSVSGGNFLPHMLPAMICEHYGGRLTDACYLFVTDMPALCSPVYTLYQNTFAAFALLDRGEAPYVTSDRLYANMAKVAGIRPMYTDAILTREYTDTGAATGLRALDRLVADIDRIYHDFLNNRAEARIFRQHSAFYLFEPSAVPIASHVIVDVSPKRGDSASAPPAPSPHIGNTKLLYPFDENQLLEITGIIKQVSELPDLYYAKLDLNNAAEERFVNIISGSGELRRRGYIRWLDLCARSHMGSTRMYLLSLAIALTGDLTEKTAFVNEAYDTVISADMFPRQEMYFLWWQLQRIPFANTGVGDDVTARRYRELYREVYRAYLREYKNELSFIPTGQRNKRFALVITGQVLGVTHGPTKVTMDMAHTLMTQIGMDVLVVNTKEVLGKSGMMPFYGAYYGNSIYELENANRYAFNGVNIPFRQLGGIMPNTEGIRQVIDIVKERRPYFILSVGGGGIVPDILSNLVPTICLSLGFGLTATEGQFQVIGRQKTGDELALVRSFGFADDHIIAAKPTYNFAPQTLSLTRAELKLPGDRFILLTVGARLTEEVHSDFVEMLIATLCANTHFAFVGIFSTYQQFCDAYPTFAEHSTFLGLQPGILHVLETCDLYVNPKRLGGGTSGAEALYMGVPVATLDYGDIAGVTGGDFHVSSYGEMSETIIRYATDRAFYDTMSAKAKERAAQLTDTAGNLAAIIKKAESSPLFDRPPTTNM